MPIRPILLMLSLLGLWGTPWSPALAQTEAPAESATVGPEEPSPDPLEQSLRRLQEIREFTLAKRKQMDELKEELKGAELERQQDIERQLAALPESIEKLNRSFEQVAIGGIDLDALNEQPTAEFNWQQELEQITRPLFASLKDLTEKPRKVEQLRSSLVLLNDQLKVVEQAIASIEALRAREPAAPVAERLARLDEEWRQRRTDLQGAREVANYQLASLQGRHVSTWDAVRDTITDFGKGRGLTLLLAVAAGIVIWLLSRLVLNLVQRMHKAESSRQRLRWNRMALYVYRLATSILVILGLVAVFYTRGDLLLLALVLIGLVMLVINLRQTLPKYIAEIRILVDMGAVREEERVIYQGLPMQVKSIRTFVILGNPELEGIVRLPIGQAAELISRPCGEEPWFPARVGDFVLFADGRVTQVLRQSVEQVELRQAGAILHYPTAAFYNMDFRNLSQEGFGLAVVFGVDYRHQAECLDQIPRRMREALEQAFAEKGWDRHTKDLLVTFKEAGVNSLDYLIYADLQPALAESYFKVGRLIQKTLVAACNAEGWVIPFAQLTVHAGEGFAPPGAASSAP